MKFKEIEKLINKKNKLTAIEKEELCVGMLNNKKARKIVFMGALKSGNVELMEEIMSKDEKIRNDYNKALNLNKIKLPTGWTKNL